jgi:tetratricopeptide (TPR) repeat protein
MCSRNASVGKGDYDRAIADFNEAIRLNPTDDNQFSSGMRETTFHKCLLENVFRVHAALAYSGRANVYRKKGEQDRAIADYRKVLVLKPVESTRQQAETALRELGVSR